MTLRSVVGLRFGLAVVFAGSFFWTSCAHLGSRGPEGSTPPAEVEPPLPKSLTEAVSSEPEGLGPKQDPKKAIVVRGTEIIVQGVKLKNTQFDLPITINSRVEYWVDYFCGRGRGYFEKYLDRSEFFIPYIVPLLKQNNLPEDLVYLAMIESGFNNFARSRAKAVGPWQFISATGRRYGLMVNWWVDERRDTAKATLAAVGYLRDLYNMFKSWELAAASYNAGEAKVARAVRRFGSRDFWVISKQQFLRHETRDYVPKIIAAALISKNRTQFGFKEGRVLTERDEVVSPGGEVVKLVPTASSPASGATSPQPTGQASEIAGASETAASALRASLEEDDDFICGEEGVDCLHGTEATPIAQSGKVEKPKELAKVAPTPRLTKSGEVRGEEILDFEVQSPADLLKVARAAGLSYQTVKSLNPEILRWCTPPTVGSYRIKLPLSSKDKFLANYNHISFPKKVQFLSYRVKKGDTLQKIAHHFGIKVDPMSDLNRVNPQAPLRSGAQVYLPLPNDRSRSLASLEVRDPPERARRSRRVRSRRTAKSRKQSNAQVSERSKSAQSPGKLT